MKKFFVIIAGALLFASCNSNLNVDIKYPVTANIDIENVANYIKDVDGSLIYNDGTVASDEYIVLDYMLYDASGNLVAQDSIKPKSFLEKPSITKSLSQGEYTLVVCAYVGDNTYKLEWWKPTGIDNLNNFKLMYNGGNYVPTLAGMLGFYKQTISVSKSEELSISVSPAVSFLVFDFQNLPTAGIQTVEFYVKTWSNFLNVMDGKANIGDISNYLYWDLKKTTYSNVLTILYYLPTPSYTVMWQGLNAANAVVKGPFNIPSEAIVAGKTYYIKVDTSTGQAVISEL